MGTGKMINFRLQTCGKDSWTLIMARLSPSLILQAVALQASELPEGCAHTENDCTAEPESAVIARGELRRRSRP